MLKQPEASITLDNLQFLDEEQSTRVGNDVLRMAMFGGQKREVLAVDKSGLSFPLEIAVSPVILKDALYYLGYLVDVRDLTLFQDLTVKQELLLRSVLDSRVLSRLLTGVRTINDHFESVTVGHIEIVDYYNKSLALDTDQQRANFAHEVFHVVDTVVGESAISKIKSMGQSYIVACGIPMKRDDHATLVVVACIAIQQAMEVFNKLVPKGKTANDKSMKERRKKNAENQRDDTWKLNLLPIHLRIGIHSGPAIGAFYSQLKGEYNVYGTASIKADQLKEGCRPQYVHISAETHRLMSPELIPLCDIRTDNGIPYTYEIRCTEEE
jgi:class 3 adenylate cyclase